MDPILKNNDDGSPADASDTEVICCNTPTKKRKLDTGTPSDSAEPSTLTGSPASSHSRKVPQSTIPGDSEVPNPIVRSKQQEKKQNHSLTATEIMGIPVQSSTPQPTTGFEKVFSMFSNLIKSDSLTKPAAVRDIAGRTPMSSKVPHTFANGVTASAQNPFTAPTKPALLVSTKIEPRRVDGSQLLNGNKSPDILTASSGGPVEETKYQKILPQLLEVFPNVEVAYLEKKCKELADFHPIDFIIDFILNQQDFPMMAPKEVSPEIIEASYQALKDLLPDADPKFLRNQAEMVGMDSAMVELFVSDAFERGDYPRKASNEPLQSPPQATEKKPKDTFDLLKFLELFPDPFTHFRDPFKLPAPRRPVPAGRDFLMARYHTIRCVVIDEAYKRNRWMLYPTCKELDRSTDKMRPRKNHEIIIIDTRNSATIMHEIALVENEDAIREHLRAVETASKEKARAIALAKEKGELLECGCCFDSEVLFDNIVTCDEGHTFCKECVRKAAEVQIGMGRMDLPCLDDCGANIRLETLEAVLLPSVFARLAHRKQIEEVKAARIQGFDVCPYCDFGLILHPDDRVFVCLNPYCLKKSCRLCKRANHVPLRCDEVDENSEEVNARKYIEDRMTEALVRECWKCGKKFVKTGGCNKMACSCGAFMCYVCRKPVTNYSHFNGQGGDAFEKCPLFSSDNQLHVDAVKEVALKAKEEISARNPALVLKHDPTLILPKKVNEPVTHLDPQFLLRVAPAAQLRRHVVRRPEPANPAQEAAVAPENPPPGSRSGQTDKNPRGS